MSLGTFLQNAAGYFGAGNKYWGQATDQADAAKQNLATQKLQYESLHKAFTQNGYTPEDAHTMAQSVLMNAQANATQGQEGRMSKSSEKYGGGSPEVVLQQQANDTSAQNSKQSGEYQKSSLENQKDAAMREWLTASEYLPPGSSGYNYAQGKAGVPASPPPKQPESVPNPHASAEGQNNNLFSGLYKTINDKGLVGLLPHPDESNNGSGPGGSAALASPYTGDFSGVNPPKLDNQPTGMDILRVLANGGNATSGALPLPPKNAIHSPEDLKAYLRSLGINSQ